MVTIIDILSVLSLELPKANLRILSEICKSIFRLTGKVTGLNISRYTDKGGSYRNIQRLFAEEIDWLKLHITLFDRYLFNKNDTFIIASDEVVEDKAGKSTFGISRFFSSISGKVIRSISFLHISFLSVDNHDSYSISSKQIIKQKKEKGKSNKPKRKKNKKKGRPKGSKNKDKSKVELSSLLQLLDSMLANLMTSHHKLLEKMRVQFFVGDGAYGNNNCVQMLLIHGLKLISKLHYNSALYFAYTGSYSGSGRYRKYGEKVDIDKINSKYLVETIDDKKEKYIDYVYQLEVLSKNFPCPLNVVIIIRINKKTGKKQNVILFSNDLDLSAKQIMDYYSLRFQIEFNFRDAKQFFGLSDFKNIKEKQVTNAINLSMFMTLLSKILLQKYREFFDNEKLSINDLKSLFRSSMYISKVLKINNENQLSIFNSDINLKKILTLGLINSKVA